MIDPTTIDPQRNRNNAGNVCVLKHRKERMLAEKIVRALEEYYPGLDGAIWETDDARSVVQSVIDEHESGEDE